MHRFHQHTFNSLFTGIFHRQKPNSTRTDISITPLNTKMLNDIKRCIINCKSKLRGKPKELSLKISQLI